MLHEAVLLPAFPWMGFARPSSKMRLDPIISLNSSRLLNHRHTFTPCTNHVLAARNPHFSLASHCPSLHAHIFISIHPPLLQPTTTTNLRSCLYQHGSLHTHISSVLQINFNNKPSSLPLHWSPPSTCNPHRHRAKSEHLHAPALWRSEHEEVPLAHPSPL